MSFHHSSLRLGYRLSARWWLERLPRERMRYELWRTECHIRERSSWSIISCIYCGIYSWLLYRGKIIDSWQFWLLKMKWCLYTLVWPNRRSLEELILPNIVRSHACEWYVGNILIFQSASNHCFLPKWYQTLYVGVRTRWINDFWNCLKCCTTWGIKLESVFPKPLCIIPLSENWQHQSFSVHWFEVNSVRSINWVSNSLHFVSRLIPHFSIYFTVILPCSE